MSDPVCPDGFDLCNDYGMAGSHCSINCMDDMDCPADPNATATPVCVGIGQQRCALDCSNDATCPDGMECATVFMTIQRCVYAP
jgi:hypothetical protein